MPAEKTESAAKLNRWDYLIALLPFIVIVLQGVKTIHAIGISWDEPYFFTESKRYFDWAVTLGKGSFSEEVLVRTFGFHLALDNHPLLFKITGAITYGLFKNFMGGFWAYRINAVIVFGLLLAIIYLWSAYSFGRIAGIASLLAAALMPRLFINAQIGTTEGPLCFFWLLATITFAAAAKRRSLIPLAGLCYGLAMSVKLTGWLLPVPLIVWACFYQRKNLVLLIPSLLLIGLAVFLMLEPHMWHGPMTGLRIYLLRSVKIHNWNPVYIMFLGQLKPNGPWYYAPFMTLITTPEIILILFLAGLARFVRGGFRHPTLSLCVINFLFLIGMTLLPGAPLYDGVRQFIPAFVFLAIISGYGLDGIARLILGASSRMGRKAIAGLVAAILLIFAALPLYHVYPYGLEYYNQFIGGVAGANKRGMETTYWWTVLNEASLQRINNILPRDAVIRFYIMYPELYNLYKEMGLIRPDIRITEGDDAQYAVVLSRPLPDFDPWMNMLGIGNPKILAYSKLDGVILWALYDLR